MEIVYLRINKAFDEVLTKLSSEVGASLVTRDHATSRSFSGPLIVEVSIENIDSINTLLEERNEKVIIALRDKESFNLIEKLKSQFEKIFGFLDLSQEPSYNLPLMKNYLSQNYSKSILQVEKLSSDLEKILQHTVNELSQVKELHDRFVKLRTEKLKGGVVQIKYMAGSKSGGEIFDLIEIESEIVFINVGCDSYVMSSLIIGMIEQLKNQKSNLILDVEKFIAEILVNARQLNAKVNYLVGIINLKHMELQYFQRGNSKIFLEKEMKKINGNGVLKLARGEKLFFISEGAIRNWSLNYKESDLESFLSGKNHLKSKDLINEFFFALFRHKKDAFLKYDAIMGALEIDQNVIYQV